MPFYSSLRLAVCAVLTLGALFGQQSNPSVVISQVYGGGGNASATYTNDYVELFNRSGASVSINGWSVQYASSTGSGWSSTRVNLPNASIPAGGYYLIQMASTAAVGSALPTADTTSSINMSGSAGKVALVNSTTALTGTCPTDASIVDFVGYGTAANCSENVTNQATSASNAPAPSNTTAAVRKLAGCTDTNNNNSDFTATTPNPRNSSTATNSCSGSSVSVGLNPTSGTQGATNLALTITGTNTNFVQGTTTVGISGTGVTVGTVTVASGTSLSTTLTIGGSATTGSRTVTVTTNAEAPTASFTVNAPAATISVNPNNGDPGTAVNITVTGTNTNFVQGTTTVGVSGTGVTAGTVTVASATSLSTTLTLTGVAASGARTLTVSTNSEAPTTPFTVNTVSAVSKKIYEINGSGAASPLAGTAVVTTGVVTGIRATTGSTKAFYIESLSADRDNDAATSEGVQVFIGSAALPACAVVGNQITITATVTDFVSSSAPVGSVPLTELTSPTICTVVNTDQLGVLPSAVTIDSNNPLPVGGSATYTRRYLGMRVSMPSALVAAPSGGNFTAEANATKTPSGQFYVTLPNVTRPLRGTGLQATRKPSDAAGTVPLWNVAPEVLLVDIAALATAPTTPYEVTTGMTISGLSGIVDFNTSAQSQYQISSNDAGKGTPSLSSPTLSFTAVSTPLASDLTIASANVERFYDATATSNGAVTLTSTAYAGRLAKLSMGVRNVLKFPDIITFEEVEGSSPSAGSDPATLSDIATKINNDAVAASQGNPNYDFCIGRTNDPGGIAIGFLYKKANSKVTLLDCTQYGVSTTYTTPALGTSTLNDRPPYVLRANVKAAGSDSGITVRVMGNHLLSLLTVDQPGTANGDRRRAKRNEQAKYAAGLIRGTIEQNSNWASNDNLILVGDFNAFDVNDGYVDSMNCIAGNPAPANQQYTTAAQAAVSTLCTSSSPALTLLTSANRTLYYSYTFAGAIQTLDHVLLSSKANARFCQLNYARVHADFADGTTYRNDFTRPERYSDHDPAVVYLNLPMEVTSRTRLNASAIALNRGTGRYNGTISVTNTGATALTGPVYVFFAGLPTGVTLPDLPVVNGMPMATITLPVAGLAAGATSSTAAISFANPTNARISYTTTRYDAIY